MIAFIINKLKKRKVRPKARQPKMTVTCRVLCNSTMLEMEELRNRISSSEDSSTATNKSYITADTNSTSGLREDPHAIPTSMSPPIDIPVDCWENVDFFTRYWNLNEEESTKLLELQDELQDVDHALNTPNFAIRFLRTKAFHVAKAATMFRDMVAWRMGNSVDTLCKDYEPPTKLYNMYPGAILRGTDHHGDPIFLSRMGVTDLPGLLQVYGHEELLRFEIFKRESACNGTWLHAWEQRQGRPIRQITVIEDLHGLSRRIICSKVAQLYGAAMELDQSNYPDLAKKIYVIRAPAIFRAVWSMAKHFFPPFIRDKMEFCGSHDYLNVLEENMDLSILPPCIHPKGGRGEAAPGFSPNFEGGRVAVL